ncbi:hypothetical protein RMSM_03778 [Rhodopirellula maiorica SM1]|uniref:Uncharacterized protein n=1 Tax=Rhodopirellula maiorica SM1 TaxID=1265738 RepID=M5RJ20_9BACT|nr:hypothetical protein RMSM_03778 [Rhodopirellula maiorica SM1]
METATQSASAFEIYKQDAVQIDWMQDCNLYFRNLRSLASAAHLKVIKESFFR